MSPEFDAKQLYERVFSESLNDPQFRKWQEDATKWLSNHNMTPQLLITRQGLEISVTSQHEENENPWVIKANMSIEPEVIDTTYGRKLTSGVEGVEITKTFGKIIYATGRIGMRNELKTNEDLTDVISREDGAWALAYAAATISGFLTKNFSDMIPRFIESYYDFMDPRDSADSIDE